MLRVSHSGFLISTARTSDQDISYEFGPLAGQRVLLTPSIISICGDEFECAALAAAS